jgi:uncharacterized protein YbcI
MVSPSAPLKGGAFNAAVSNAVVGILSKYAGRGPTRARTMHSGRVVVCMLEDTMTKPEQHLAVRGEEDLVLEMRHALQRAMRDDLTSAVESFTGRKVVAFLSANHIAPDLAAEVFVLDEPLPESVAAATGAQGFERSLDPSSQAEDSQ